MHTLPDSELPKGPASRALVSRKRIFGWILNPEKMWISALGYMAARSRRLGPGAWGPQPGLHSTPSSAPPALPRKSGFSSRTGGQAEAEIEAEQRPSAPPPTPLCSAARGRRNCHPGLEPTWGRWRWSEVRSLTCFCQIQAPESRRGLSQTRMGCQSRGLGKGCGSRTAMSRVPGCSAPRRLPVPRAPGAPRQPHSSGRRQLVSQPHGRRP